MPLGTSQGIARICGAYKTLARVSLGSGETHDGGRWGQPPLEIHTKDVGWDVDPPFPPLVLGKPTRRMSGGTWSTLPLPTDPEGGEDQPPPRHHQKESLMRTLITSEIDPEIEAQEVCPPSLFLCWLRSSIQWLFRRIVGPTGTSIGIGSHVGCESMLL